MMYLLSVRLIVDAAHYNKKTELNNINNLGNVHAV
jgi:hypothetical protein